MQDLLEGCKYSSANRQRVATRVEFEDSLLDLGSTVTWDLLGEASPRSFLQSDWLKFQMFRGLGC